MMELFDIWYPATPQVPVIVSIPHTGTWIPPEILETIAPGVLRDCPGIDWHLRTLYDFLPALGITTIVANVARLVVDLNRPSVFRPLYPGRAETGVVALQTPQGQRIFRHDPDPVAIQQRIECFWAPYQQKLQQLIDSTRQLLGLAVLVDAHSVAAGAALLHSGLEADVYLGDRDGRTCNSELMRLVEERFQRNGYRTRLDAPYKGGYIVDHYGSQPGVQALEIEMCQHTYMDERHPSAPPDADRIAQTREALIDVYKAIIYYAQQDWRPAAAPGR